MLVLLIGDSLLLLKMLKANSILSYEWDIKIKFTNN